MKSDCIFYSCFIPSCQVVMSLIDYFSKDLQGGDRVLGEEKQAQKR